MVLPPLRPLFARPRDEDDARHSFAELAGSLRTPTSAQAGAFLGAAGFPSSSPVKKDNPLLSAAAKGGAMPLLRLNSPPPADAGAVAIASDDQELRSLDHDHTHASPPADEKLRVSRERNRLHAQRTRIRKRELLESLKDRIGSLQEEFALLKQTYDFHATATCLLRLGSAPEQTFACVRQLDEASDDELDDADDCDPLAVLNASAAAFHGTADTDVCMDDGDESAHEKGCMCHDEDLPADERSAACTCIAKELLGKRGAAGGMAWSKEEREQIRRERNRLHARRARLRKKLVLERSQQVRCSL